jgi:hypothetical protein
VHFEDSVPEAERADWTERLRDDLLASGIRLPEEGDHPLPEVSVTVGVETGRGRTDAGVRFFAVRATAVLRLRRARVELRSRPGVDADEAVARREALEALVPKVEATIAW